MTTFELSKWYLDAVAEGGEVFMGYRADLRWRRVRVAYASALTGGAHEARTRSTVAPGKEPDLFEGALAWAEPELDVDGFWRAESREIVRLLHESAEGSVRWACLMPSSAAEVREGGRLVRGLGYAERLEMTLPPWKLPLDTLRWGRFLAPEHAVVWIDWEKGSNGRTWIFVDGSEVPGKVSEEGILFEGGSVDLPASGRLVLRCGRLSHLLGSLSLPRSLSRGVLAMHETKWRTRGVLECGGAPPVEGWAIHETVRWAP